jgi:hypothetical protein
MCVFAFSLKLGRLFATSLPSCTAVSLLPKQRGGILLSTTNLDHNTHSKVLSKVRVYRSNGIKKRKPSRKKCHPLCRSSRQWRGEWLYTAPPYFVRIHPFPSLSSHLFLLSCLRCSSRAAPSITLRGIVPSRMTEGWRSGHKAR